MAKKVITASEEEVGKLHINGVKLANMKLDALLAEIEKDNALPDNHEDKMNYALSIDMNEITKVLRIAHDEGLKSTDAAADGTSELAAKAKEIKESQKSNIIKFTDGREAG